MEENKKEVKVKKVKTVKEPKIKKEKIVKEKVALSGEEVKKVKLGMDIDKKIIIAITIIVVVVALSICGFFYWNNNMKPVAKFDGGSLNASEYTMYYKTFAPMLEQYGYNPNDIPMQIAEKAGTDKILIMKAKEAGVKLSDEDKKKVDELFTNEDQLKDFANRGIDPNKMKELYYNDYIISAYIAKVKSEIPDDDVSKYIKETYGEDTDMTEFITRHIVVTTQNATTDEQKVAVKAKIDAALVRVNAGEDFATLAKELSEDSTKNNGGLYKMYLDNNTSKEYVEAVKGLEVGKTTGVVTASYGYHIIKLEEKNVNGRINSDSEREAIASKKIDEMSKKLNLKVDDNILKKLVEKITGIKANSNPETDIYGK
ncbi:MAG: peptidylprolyl isomerase [Clostridia bacterium]